MSETMRLPPPDDNSVDALRLLGKQVPALVWTTDTDLCFTSSQGAALASLGLGPGEADGQPLASFGDMSRALSAHRRALQGESVSYEGRLRGRTFEAHVEPLRNAAGQIIGCIGVALDVTGRRQAEEELRTTSEMLKALVEASPLAMVAMDAESRVTLWSPGAERAFGWKAEEILGQRFPIVPDDKWGEHVSFRDRVLAGERFVGIETRRRDRTGAAIDVRISAAPLRDARGHLRGVASFIEDLSDRKRAERAIRRLASMPEQNPDPLVELDLSGNTLYVNQAARSRFPDLQALGSWHPVLAPVASILPRFRHGEEKSFSFEVSHQGAVYHEMAYYVPDAAVVRVFLHDVTEQHRARALLEHEAQHDRLTELPNRPAFLRRLEEEIHQARQAGASSFAVLSINLDRFKVINDSLGQGAGDQFLARVARRLSACLSADDMTARIGSDDFVVLLRGRASQADSVRLAEHVHEAISLPLEVSGHEIFPSASLGLAFGEGYEAGEPLLRDAQIAMYRAKGLGGGRCEPFDRAMGNRSLERMRLENELRRAIERGELRVFYQPIIRLSDGTITGFEALLRWPRQDLPSIPPAEFIPVAEEAGLIQALTYWTLGQVCQRLREWGWPKTGGGGPVVHLNLSSKLFSDPMLAERIRTALATARVDGERLVLEITESVLMEDLDSAVATLIEIKQLGVGIAMDDFGTGYSSLSYLQRLPLDSLKIDRSFVAKIGERGENAEILRAILTLARNLAIAVIAEGVETREQLTQLLAMGCGLAQGYLFSRPVDQESAHALLAAPPWAGLLSRSEPRRPAVLPEPTELGLRRSAVS